MNNDFIIAETFIQRLRNSTAQSHKNLEALPVSVSVANPGITIQEYILYLMLMRDVVYDAETNIYPALATIITDIGQRKKLHFIDKDLTVLSTPLMQAATPLSKNNKEHSVAFALGIMYVVEGSSLGGRVLLKNINASLGYDETHGARYFAGYGPQTGSTWKAFMEVMQGYAAKNHCEDEIIAGADFAFKAIYSHFNGATSA